MIGNAKTVSTSPAIPNSAKADPVPAIRHQRPKRPSIVSEFYHSLEGRQAIKLMSSNAMVAAANAVISAWS